MKTIYRIKIDGLQDGFHLEIMIVPGLISPTCKKMYRFEFTAALHTRHKPVITQSNRNCILIFICRFLRFGRNGRDAILPRIPFHFIRGQRQWPDGFPITGIAFIGCTINDLLACGHQFNGIRIRQ